ncbi:jerky protein homolog-like [Armigeres subalbatus]|uniref:jerky protein homolog-like n=1 Tax=Armigeres subalbatus TaxID=124917 RepID=UPI002ECFCA75
MEKQTPVQSRRKHTTLSLNKKLEIRELIEKRGEKIEILARSYGVGRSTIYDIYKQKERIKCSSDKLSASGLKTRRTTKLALYPQMEEALFIWVLQQRLQQNVITPDVVKTKAEFFFAHLQDPSEKFTASNGWYNRFRARHGLKMISLSGERASADIAAFENFRELFSDLVATLDLSPSQIYNADESALFLKLLPNRTIALQDEDIAAGRKVIKNRCTFMPCANSDGTHKLPLMFLGTAENPRCLPRDKSQLPVYYKHSKKAWTNRSLFNEWFHTQFVPLVQAFSIQQGIEPKALLLLAHHEGSKALESEDGLISVVFLPPNCTSEGQPMDQGVINAIKKRYKKKLLLNVVLAADEFSVDDRLKKISLAESIEWVAEAWDKVSA